MKKHLLDGLEDICIIGHPFAPTGRGEDLRCMLRSLQAVGAKPRVRDVYKLDPRRDQSLVTEFDGTLVDQSSATFNVFLLNGDELAQALPHIGGLPKNAINVIYPAWELPNYPTKWAMALEQFDEVWAPSQFIADSILGRVSIPVIHMPLACETKVRTFHGRRHFDIPESAFAFLFTFDFTSFISRKNPFAVIDAFAKAYASFGEPDACLVLKLNRGALAIADYERFLNQLGQRRERIILIDATLSNDEIKSLARCCDAFVSLHRSEGFGRGISEAMCLGKPVIVTAWSGNMDFTQADVSCLVDYRLVPVGENEYLCGDGQVWAEPDVDQAADFMLQLIRDRSWAAELGARASRHMRVNYSYRARGLSYLSRIMELLHQQQDVAKQ